MQIVIDIDEGIMQGIIEGKGDKPREIVRSFQTTIADAIKNGTPLPKEHGKLVDANKLKKVYDERITYLYALNKKDNPSRETRVCTINWCNNTVDELPTIIEADKEERGRMTKQGDVNAVLRDIKAEVKKQIVDLQDGSEEWRSYVNETVLETLEIIDKYIIEED